MAITVSICLATNNQIKQTYKKIKQMGDLLLTDCMGSGSEALEGLQREYGGLGGWDRDDAGGKAAGDGGGGRVRPP